MHRLITSHLTVLGPLLLLICVNDLASLSTSEGSQVSLYADCLQLYWPIYMGAYYKLNKLISLQTLQ